VTWSNDPEMQKMFLDEVTERSARLVEGAQALRAGSVTSQEAGDLLREGHTIKGTGRVMGYEDVGSAGLMLEMIWRWIQQGDITPVPIFGRILEALSAAIPRALDDPDSLAEAMAAVHDFFEGQTLPAELPAVPGAGIAESGDGGLETAVEAAVASDASAGLGAAAAEEDEAIVHFGEPTPTADLEESDASVDGADLGDDAAAVVADEPVLSAHEMFAQLAAGGANHDEADADEMAVDEAAGDVVRTDEAAEAVGEDAAAVVADEPVLSAHEMFAQLAAGGADLDDDRVEGIVVAEIDRSRDGDDAEAAGPPEGRAEGESGTTTEEAARSAQEAFAELRRSLVREEPVAEVAAPPDAAAPTDQDVDSAQDEAAMVVAMPHDVERASAVPHEDGDGSQDDRDLRGTTENRNGQLSEDEERSEADLNEVVEGKARSVEDEMVDSEDAAEPADDPTRRIGGAAGEAPVGSVIDFPVAPGDPIAAESADGIDGSSDGSGSADEAEPTDVVVLPSNRTTTARSVTEPDDLGGLVGAVQTWAAEEPISVNTGRLYGLVNHIVSLRMDIESAKTEVAELAELAAADPFFSDRVSHMAEAIEPIARSSEAIEAQALALAAAPLRDVTNTLPQLGRYLSRKTGKELRVEIVGDDILVDRQVLDRIGDAIRQLVVNSAVHGIEDIDTRLGAGKRGTGAIRIEAVQTDVNLEVAVVDDGRGIDWQGIREKGIALGLLEPSSELAPDALRSLLYRSGFTTQEAADELSGDGDGLALVREAMESLNGSLRVESTPKVETRISMVVPVHQAMQKALLVRTAGIIWGIPETGIVEIVDMNLATIAVADHTTVLERVDGDVPFASFADLMGLSSDAVPASIVVASSAAGPVALGVEEVVGVRRIAAKELGAVLADAETDLVTGAALLGGDQVALLVDPTRLAERQREAAIEAPALPPARVLIVDDSVGVQQVVSSALATSGFNTTVAASVADALGILQTGTIDAIVVDFSMPRADGVALAHMVRQRHGDLPIIMLSGVAEGEDVDRAREAGVDAFFDKSDFREGGLAEKLRELITARGSEERTA
jgi:two-component system chemotaxis sensor kinase CheA